MERKRENKSIISSDEMVRSYESIPAIVGTEEQEKFEVIEKRLLRKLDLRYTHTHTQHI